jgi:hypothetical protein
LCVCVQVNKKEQVKEILKTLLEMRQPAYTERDIEKAIMQHRGLDPRTLKNWFRYLWRMEYLIQQKKSLYQLNYDKVAELELDSLVVDVNQRRLFYA